ncbi:MAG: hypothetical protein J5711_09310 [Bacteroidales bacterium]|nr:hypothetical protein [Bacteroidales bacterium]
MSTFMVILAVLLPIAACVLIPIWMKKKGKGKNTFIRILVGVACALPLMILFSALSDVTMTDEEKEAKRVSDSIRMVEQQRKDFIKDSTKAEEKRKADSIEAERNKPLKSEWIDRSWTDEMTDEENVSMTLTSDNYFEFDFPYNGGTRLKIDVRYRKQDGNQVLLSVNRGQLMETTSYQKNEVVVRFDDDAPMRFTTNEPADHSSNLLFLNNPRKFINRAKTANKILIQVPTYDNGQPTFSFEPAEPLKWSH